MREPDDGTKERPNGLTTSKIVGICSLCSGFWGIIFGLGFYLFYSNASGRALEVRIIHLEQTNDKTQGTLAKIADTLVDLRENRIQMTADLSSIKQTLEDMKERKR